MPPRGRPLTRSLTRALGTEAGPSDPALTPEGHVQTLLEGPSGPDQAQQHHPLPGPSVLPSQLQAVSHLLEVLERRSQGIIQQEMAAIAHEPVPQNPRDHPRSPTRTAASRRPQPLQVPTQPGPAKEPRRKHRGKPPGPPSPPGTTSSSTELSSSSSSSSSRESSPRVRNKAKQKASEPRGRPSPFASEIAKTKIPRALEKPPQLPTYTGKGDPDEHVDTFDLILDYRDASDNVRCKLFPLSLSKAALKWYRELSPGSIKSWTQFTQLFSARFTASRVKPKSADILQGVKQGDKETLREYLERYNQVADEVDNLSDDIRVMFMRHGLRKGTLFRQEMDSSRRSVTRSSSSSK